MYTPFVCILVLILNLLSDNTLVISDVVGLSSPNSIKSSITTVTSSTSSNAGAFISIRGQGLRAETFENDYIKIIKQH